MAGGDSRCADTIGDDLLAGHDAVTSLARQPYLITGLFRDDGTNYKQAGRDTIFGVSTLILSAVYAVMWPATYRDAPKAPRLMLTSNIFSSMSSICEVPLALMPAPTPYNAGDTVLAYDLPIKAALYLIGAILGFTANVLGLVD